jgi:hypothetical protein
MMASPSPKRKVTLPLFCSAVLSLKQGTLVISRTGACGLKAPFTACAPVAAEIPTKQVPEGKVGVRM